MIARGGCTPAGAECLVYALCRSHRVAAAKQLVLRLASIGIAVTPPAYGAVVNALIKGNHLDEIVTFLLNLHQQGVAISPKLLHTVVVQCIGAGRTTLATDIYVTHDCLAGNTATTTVILATCSRQGDANNAMRLVDHLKAYEGDGDGITAEHVVHVARTVAHVNGPWPAFAVLVDAYQQRGITVRPSIVLDIFRQIAATPGELQHLRILCEDVEAQVGIPFSWDMAAPLCEAMVRESFVMELINVLQWFSAVHDVKPPVAWLNHALDELCVAMRVDLADEMLRCVDAKWNVKSFSAVIREASSVYDVEKFAEYMTAMKTLNIKADTFAWNCKLRVAYNLRGDSGRAEVYREFLASGVPKDNYTNKVLKFTSSRMKVTDRTKRKGAAYRKHTKAALAAGKALVMDMERWYGKEYWEGKAGGAANE